MQPYKYVSISKWIDSQHKIKAAVHLADLGIPVFSCKPDKSPNTPHGFKDATRDQESLVGMFAEPDLRIGMPTGKASGFTVVDIDPKNGADKSVGKLKIPNTRTAQTPSGGLHFYFKEAGIRNSASLLAPGVDIRGEGGYVIVPPSEGYKWLNNAESVDYPPHLMPCKKRGATLKATGLDIEAIRNGVPAGQRNDLIFRGLCKFRHSNKPIEDAKEWAADAATNSTPPYHEVDTDEMAERVYAEYGPGEDFVTSEEKAEQEHQERVQRAQDAWNNPKVQKIARSYDILDRFRGELEAAGIVGVDKQLKLLFAAGHSRFLDRPISVAVKGPSAGGKSKAVECAILNVQPDDAYIFFSGMSEKALIHSEADYRHKLLIVAEQAGVESEYQDYLFRTLLSESVIKYSVTEKVDGRFVVNEKVKEGPTGLITSTTRAKLHPENETRILSIHITDTRDHTKAIMKAQANDNRREMDTEPWKAYGTWLAGQDNRVSIPYSEALADLIPVYDVRQNRDITMLLNTIKTLAVMHQARRERDAQGRIIATMQDYRIARDLLNDLLSQGIGATVSQSVRDTVAAVKALAPDGKTTNSKAVAQYLAVGKGAASNRISNALSEGYIVNLQEPGKRGHKLALGSPLPEDTLLLPEPHELLNAAACNIVQQFTSIWGCTKAIENLPSIVHLIVHPETRTKATVPVFDKPYDLRQHTESPYVGHGEPDEGDENPEQVTGRLAPPKQGELLNYVTKSSESVTSGDGSEGDERTKGELKFADLPADPEDWGVYEVVRHLYATDPDFCARQSDAQLWSHLVQCGLIPSGTPVSDVADARARVMERAT